MDDPKTPALDSSEITNRQGLLAEAVLDALQDVQKNRALDVAEHSSIIAALDVVKFTILPAISIEKLMDLPVKEKKFEWFDARKLISYLLLQEVAKTAHSVEQLNTMLRKTASLFRFIPPERIEHERHSIETRLSQEPRT